MPKRPSKRARVQDDSDDDAPLSIKRQHLATLIKHLDRNTINKILLDATSHHPDIAKTLESAAATEQGRPLTDAAVAN